MVDSRNVIFSNPPIFNFETIFKRGSGLENEWIDEGIHQFFSARSSKFGPYLEKLNKNDLLLWLGRLGWTWVQILGGQIEDQSFCLPSFIFN